MSRLLEKTHLSALSVAARLRNRGEKIAVADGATGGLIAASLLTVPGAMDFFVGGAVVYSFRARDVLFALPRRAYAGMRGASEEYALLQANAIRENLGGEWGIAESGSVGGSSHPTGALAGQSAVAVVGPECEFSRTLQTGSDDRIANMETFARHALEFLADVLEATA